MGWATKTNCDAPRPTLGNPASLVPKIERTPAAAELAFITLGNYLASPARNPVPTAAVTAALSLSAPDQAAPPTADRCFTEAITLTDTDDLAEFAPPAPSTPLIILTDEDDWTDEPSTIAQPAFTAAPTEVSSSVLDQATPTIASTIILTDEDDWTDEPTASTTIFPFALREKGLGDEGILTVPRLSPAPTSFSLPDVLTSSGAANTILTRAAMPCSFTSTPPVSGILQAPRLAGEEFGVRASSYLLSTWHSALSTTMIPRPPASGIIAGIISPCPTPFAASPPFSAIIGHNFISMGDKLATPSTNTDLRCAEIIAALSLATDLGTGQPLERALRTCLLAFRLGELSGLTDDELRTVYYVALLRFVGCTADAQHLADIFGDELVAQARVSTVELLPAPMLAVILRHAGEGYPLSERLQKVVYGLTNGVARTREAEIAHCEVSQNIARQFSLNADIGLALGQIYERWDGRGLPAALKGEALSKAIRLVHIAQDAEVFFRVDGLDTAVNIVRKRAGGFYDPVMVECFVRHSAQLLSELNSGDTWATILDIEPTPRLCLDEAQIEVAIRAIADFIDLRSVYMRGHSASVGELAFESAARCGLTDDEAIIMRRAGYVHDLGRVAIPLTLWDKAAPLNSAEVERVRLYPYYTERILARSSYLAPLGSLAALHRERLDGSGYHRGLPASLLSTSARLLAASDVYQSKIESRAYRTALSPPAAADDLLSQVRAGKLDKQAVTAVLETATGKRVQRKAVRVANLSDREVEVLRLLSQGLPTRQIAAHLYISPKTADHHIQHIYNKLGVSTRAAAIFFALQNNLLQDFPPDLTAKK